MKRQVTKREFIKDITKKGVAIIAASRTTAFPTIVSASEVTPTTEAMFYKQLDGVMIQCMLEPRQCIVNDWERGYCGAKENRGGKYYTLVYSQPCAVYVEPIEREHFYHVYPGSEFLGIGTAGCNLECKYCETWNISQVRPEETEVQNLSPENAVRRAVSEGCRTIAFTYNDPVISYEYVLATARIAKQAGLTTLCHTAGYIYTEPLKKLLEHMDAVNVDLKGFTDKYYLEMCGVDLEQVLNTLKIIKQEDVVLEITNLIVPGRNDDHQDISNMATWIRENLGSDVPLHFPRFFPNFQLTDIPATPVETLDAAYDIARSSGLNYVYVDNVPGHERGSTYCPGCGIKLIHRSGSEVTILELDEKGHCGKCGHAVPGIWM